MDAESQGFLEAMQAEEQRERMLIDELNMSREEWAERMYEEQE